MLRLFHYSLVQRNKPAKPGKDADAQELKTAKKAVWYIRVFDPETKKISYRSTKTNKKFEAQQILDKLKNEALNPETKSENVKITEALEKWGGSKKVSCVGITIDLYQSYIKRFKEYVQEENLDSLSDFGTKEAIDFFNGYAEKEPCTANTMKNRKSVFSSFFNWAFDYYGIDKKNPFKSVKTPKGVKPKREAWTVEQIDKILNSYTNPDERLFCAFQAFAGLRFNEAKNVCWDDIRGGTLTVVGKGSKRETLPIGKRLKNEISIFLNGKEQPQNGKIYTIPAHSCMTKRLKKIVSKLDLKADGPTHFHRFRHSFASGLLRAGASIVTTSKLMRHATVSMTLNIYSHCIKDDLEEAVNLL